MPIAASSGVGSDVGKLFLVYAEGMDFLIQGTEMSVVARLDPELDYLAKEVADHFDGLPYGSHRVVLYAPVLTPRRGVQVQSMEDLIWYGIEKVTVPGTGSGEIKLGIRFWSDPPEALVRHLVPTWEEQAPRAGFGHARRDARMKLIWEEIERRWPTPESEEGEERFERPELV